MESMQIKYSTGEESMLYCVPKGRIAFHRGENTNGGKRMNIFDIVGPIMVGPSSSHTAGAVRIGYITRRLLGEPVIRAEIGPVSYTHLTLPTKLEV